MTRVKLRDVIDGFEFTNFAGGDEAMAYVCRDTGVVYCLTDDDSLNEDLPADIASSPRYLALPDKRELDLGRELALAFVQERLPDEYAAVMAFFRKSGAWARFKDVLLRRGQLDQWYAHEQAATEAALRQWCQDHGFDLAP